MSMPGKQGMHPIKDFGKSLTRQSELKYADINLIMAKYDKSGVLPPATRDGFFADVTSVGDYRDAIHRVRQADGYFMKLPAKVRSKFDNDPAVFLDFVSDAKNLGEIEAMGLIESPPKPPGQRVVAGSSDSSAQPASGASGDGGSAEGAADGARPEGPSS